MEIKWKRPNSVPYPSKWRHFEGRKQIDGKIPKFWVQDIPEEMFEEAVEFMCASYIYDEPLCRHIDITTDNESVEEFKETWRQALRHKVGLICFMENPDPSGKPVIAGVNITYICEKDEKPRVLKAEKWSTITNSVMFLVNQKDAFEELGLTEYMCALGLSVLPQFRGQGIGEEMLLARTELGKAVGLKATLTVFTAVASQKLAEKTGFKDIASMTYDEIAKIHPEFTFPGINEYTKIMRFMYKMF